MSSVGSMSSMRRTVQSDEQMKERRHQCRHSRAPAVDTPRGVQCVHKLGPAMACTHCMYNEKIGACSTPIEKQRSAPHTRQVPTRLNLCACTAYTAQ